MKDVYSVSVDDILSTELGWNGFGPAQALAMLVGGFAFMTSSVLMFQMTFAYADPLVTSGQPAWHCANSTDWACSSLLHQQALARKYATSTGPGFPERDTAPAGTAASILNPSTGNAQQAVPRSFCDLKPYQYVWNDPGLSLSSEYNLVCAQAWKVSLLDTLFFAGFMLGNGVFGAVADRHGRRITLVACAAATAVVTALSASLLVPLGPGARAAADLEPVSSNSGGGGYWMHLVLRCISGTLCAGQALGGYVLATEMMGPKWRGAAGMLTQSFFIFGEFLLVALSLAFPPWRALTLAVAASCGVSVLLAPLVPESPRWLLLHGKAGKARAAFMWVARINRVRTLPSLECTKDGQIRLLRPQSSDDKADGRGNTANTAADDAATTAADGGCTRSTKANDDEDHKTRLPGIPLLTRSSLALSPLSPSLSLPTAGRMYDKVDGSDQEETASLVRDCHDATPGAPPSNLFTVLKIPTTRRLLLSACFVLFALSVSYYGVTLALGSLVAGSLHLNFFLTAAAELPGYLVLAATTDRIGRRVAISGATALAGLACLACAFTYGGGPMQVALAMLGKMSCSGAWAVGIIFAAELFPTSIRSACVSMASQSGDLGGLVTPLLLLLSLPGRLERLPFIVMGLMSLAAIALLAKLPETRGMPQLDTFEELLDWLQRNDRKTIAATPAGATAGAEAVAAIPILGQGAADTTRIDIGDGFGARRPSPLLTEMSSETSGF